MLLNLKPGDLVFLQNKASNFTYNIAKSYKKTNYHHVAIISHITENKINLIHAAPHNGVEEFSINKSIFANAHKAELYVIYKNNLPQYIIDDAINLAKNDIGLPYNDIFSVNNINSQNKFSFYCSSFIQTIFNDAAGELLVPYIKMHFNNSTNYWQEYYNKLGAIIPYGENGTHPGSISELDFLSMI